MKKKKILVFIDWFLPGYRAGGPIQSCANLIEHLKDEFEFSVVTRDTDYMEQAPYANIKSDEWNILPNGMRVYYFSDGKLSARSIHHMLVEEEFDVVYLNGIYSLYFTLLPLHFLRKDRNVQVVVAARGMLAQSALGVKNTKKMFFLFVANAVDLFKNVNVKIAANLWQKENDSEWNQRNKNAGNVRLVSIARISPEKNIKFALDVLAKINEEVEFDLYGPVYNKTYWEECQKIISELPSNVTVNYKGSLPGEDVLKTLSEYHFLFSPTRGENFGHAILQAMRVGVPVIISDQTIWRDLKKQNAGFDIALSAERDFVSAIEKCINMNQEDYDVISKGAFDFARSFTNNNGIIEENRKLFLKS